MSPVLKIACPQRHLGLQTEFSLYLLFISSPEAAAAAWIEIQVTYLPDLNIYQTYIFTRLKYLPDLNIYQTYIFIRLYSLAPKPTLVTEHEQNS